MVERTMFIPSRRTPLSDAGHLQRADSRVVALRDPRLLWLDKNENTDPIFLSIVFKVLAEIDPGSVVFYPDVAPFYHKLAEYIDVSPRALILAQGSDGVIGSVFRAFVEPGDVVFLTQPTYAMYQFYADMCGADSTVLQYMAGESGPQLKSETIIEMIQERRPKLVCLPNPDSPTGTVFAPDDLRRIIRIALEANTLFLVDEAYYPFYSHTVVPSIVEFPNLIVARSFSKAWGLSGVRLGYGIASPELIALLHNVRPNYETNTVALAMAHRMISEFEHEMRASVKRLNQGRDGFLSAMKELGLRTLESHGSFCHVAFGTASERVHASLADYVLYRQDFSAPCLKGFSRFSSTTGELFAPIIDRIRDVVRMGGA